jgi:hypothetical protein
MPPLDFSNEPKDRAKSLHIHQAEPFNAEPEDLAEFIQHHITPSHLVYGRNHGPIPDIEESSYKLTVNGSVNQPVQLSLSDLKSMPKVEIVAALQVCHMENPLTFSVLVIGANQCRRSMRRKEFHGAMERYRIVSTLEFEFPMYWKKPDSRRQGTFT